MTEAKRARQEAARGAASTAAAAALPGRTTLFRLPNWVFVVAGYVQFITPSSLGGKIRGPINGAMSYTLKKGIFDPAHAAAVAAGRKDRTSGASAAAVNSEVLLVFRYRPNPSLEYGEWRGARFLYSDDHAGSLDGITRTMLAPGAC